MALIICPECGKEYSDRASACPNCACPTHRADKEEAPISDSSYSETNKKRNSHSFLTILIVLILTAAAVWYLFRVQSYNDGLNALYVGEYATARNCLEGLNYKDSELILNDISFLEDLEKIVEQGIADSNEGVDITKAAARTFEKISKYQSVQFYTDNLDQMVDQYLEGLERIANAFDYDSPNAIEYEILVGSYYCDFVIVNLHDNIGFMQNSPEYETAYTGIISQDEAFLTAFTEIGEKGHVTAKNGDFWYNTVTLYLKNDTTYNAKLVFIFNFNDYSGDKLLETIASDVVEIKPDSEYSVSVNVPQSAKSGYSVNYSYYVLDIDIPNPVANP